MVRVGTLMAVPGLLREFGLDPARVLAEFGLAPALFEDPDNTIAFATSGRLLDRCAKLARCPHFGLLTGRREGLSELGALGFLVQSAPDLRTALQLAVEHFHVHNSAAEIDLLEDGSSASLRFAILQKNIQGREQLLDGAMAIAFNVMRTLGGQHWLPDEVRFAHAPPPDHAPFRQFFRAALRFAEADTALIFARYWLDRAPPGADPLLHRMMAERVRDIESRFGEGLVGRLRRMLPSLIRAHRASLPVVAQRFGLGPRTLSRRLAAEGVRFMQLQEEARETLACQLLEDTGTPVNEVARRLGYANPSAFTRAFLRWTGVAPARWRASRGGRSQRRR